MTDYKIGDVAMVVCSDGVERRATYFESDWTPVWIFPDVTRRRVSDSEARPLVVIDPEDKDQIDRFIEVLDTKTFAKGTRTRRENFQQALRDLITPPRIEEPGLWGVVEASSRAGALRYKWVRTEYASNVWRTAGGAIADWSDLIDPVLVREGI